MTAKEELCKYMADFVESHFKFIPPSNFGRYGIPKTKQDLINKTKSDINIAVWVLNELANWGMDCQYLEDLFVPEYREYEDHGFQIIKLSDKYIKIQLSDKGWSARYVKPKTKTIIYF